LGVVNSFEIKTIQIIEQCELNRFWLKKIKTIASDFELKNSAEEWLNEADRMTFVVFKVK
jgi:hypothetical protein